MRTRKFFTILILSALIICLPFHMSSAQDSDQFELDQSYDYKDLLLTVTKGGTQEAPPNNFDESGNIGISLDPDKPVFSAGDLLSFTANVDRDCYLTVMYVSQSGKMIVLWPNRESGLNSLARKDVPIRIPAPQSRFQLRVDGKQPYETIVAYATMGRNNVLDEDRLSDIPGTGFRVFNGTPAELSEIFQDRVEASSNHEGWGTAQLNARISSGAESVADNEGDTKAAPKPYGPVAVRAPDGNYLSLKAGKIGWAKKLGASEIFHLQPTANDQVRIVGRYGAIKEYFDFKSNMFLAIRARRTPESTHPPEAPLPTSAPTSVAGTTWARTVPTATHSGAHASDKWNFLADGTLRHIQEGFPPQEGAWKQDGKAIYFQCGEFQYQGLISGTHMEGSGWHSRNLNLKYTWTLDLSSAPTTSTASGRSLAGVIGDKAVTADAPRGSRMIVLMLAPVKTGQKR